MLIVCWLFLTNMDFRWYRISDTEYSLVSHRATYIGARKLRYAAVNSCLAVIGLLDGWSNSTPQ